MIYSKAKKWLEQLILSFSLALILFVLTFVQFNSAFTIKGGSEVAFFGKMLGAGQLVLRKNNELPAQQEFVFIDTSYAWQLVDKVNENGRVIGKERIIDRKLLADFFQIIQRYNTHRFVLCDIFFEDSSSDDAKLSGVMSQVKNLIIPYRLEKNKQIPPVFHEITNGFTTFTAADANNTFLKIPLIQWVKKINEENYIYKKSLPVLMYEKLHNDRLSPGFLFSSMSKKLSLNSLVVDFRIRNFKKYFEPVRLTTLLERKAGRRISSDQEIEEMLRERIVIIGNFKNDDIKNTTIGPMPGSIILLNTYLALRYGDNIISCRVLAYIIGFYWIVIHNIFYITNFEERIKGYIKKIVNIQIKISNKVENKNIKRNICLIILKRMMNLLLISTKGYKQLSYIFIIVPLFSLFLYLYGIYINIIISGIILFLLEVLVRIMRWIKIK